MSDGGVRIDAGQPAGFIPRGRQKLAKSDGPSARPRHRQIPSVGEGQEAGRALLDGYRPAENWT